MEDINISQPGPSGIKRRRKITVKNPSNLTEEEMMYYLQNSDCDEDDEFSSTENQETDSDSSEDEDLIEHNSATNHSWHETCDEMRSIPFVKDNKLLVDPPESAEPYDYFRMLLDDDFLNKIVLETNGYAEVTFLNTETSSRSRITEWKDITINELLRFIGITFHTGTIKLNQIQDYWKKHRLFNLTCFSKYISRDRYLLIMRFLHFSKNPEHGQAQPDDRLYKIRPALEFLNSKMDQVYYPGKNLSLDESMVLWRGRLIFRQYIKNKRHKYGIKLYMLTEPDGLILQMLVYTGQLDAIGGKGHSQKVVLELLRGKLLYGHSIFMDNFYNSFELAKTLLQQKTFCTGTLRADRKGAPQDVVKAKLGKGQYKAQYLDGIMIGKWKDRRDVIYISTEFKNEMVLVQNRRGQEKEKPLPIVKYNECMGGVDRQDQLMSYYPAQRKTLRWYKKLGIHIFHLLLQNSHILFNKYSGKKLSYYDFRLAVLDRLLPAEEGESAMHPKISEHLPSKIIHINEKGKTLRKKCRVCTKNKKRKDTVYHCTSCADQPGLCLGQCFTEYHKKI